MRNPSYVFALVAWCSLAPATPELVVPKVVDEAFDAEREKAKETDALAQVFRISGDLVKLRLLISQVRSADILTTSLVCVCVAILRTPANTIVGGCYDTAQRTNSRSRTYGVAVSCGRLRWLMKTSVYVLG